MANEVKIIVSGQNKSKPALTGALTDVQKINTAVAKLPDNKVIKVTVKDDATKVVDDVDKKKVEDKETTVKAKDEATEVIDKVSNTKPKDVKVSVKADFEDSGGWSKFKDAGGAGADAFIGGFTGGLLGGGLIDAASSLIGDVFARAGERQRTAADIQNMMGVSPEAAKAYGDRIGHMFWDGVGDSKDQITGAFANLSSDVKDWGNLTVEQQDRIVKGAVKVSSAFRLDVQEPIRAASSMVANNLSPTFEAAFDLITGGYQNLGSRAGDTLDSLEEYSGYFAKLGFDGPHALKMIDDMMTAGARNTDYAADVWKEFGIRMLAGADDAKQALKDLRLNADKILADIAGGGPKAQEAIDKVLDRLRAMKDQRKQDQIGVALFGTQWEDTMKLVINNVDIAKGKVEDFAGATEKMATGAITETEKLGRAWDEFTTDFGEAVATQINHRDEFAKAEHDAVMSSLGFIDTVSEEIAKQYELGRSLDGTSRGFQALADTVGGYASPKFVEMIGRMSDAQLAAYGVTRAVDGTGKAVLTLPGGKTITIDTNAGKVVSDLSGVRIAVNNLPTQKFFTYYMDTVVRGPGPGSLNSLTGALRGANAAGGAVVGHAAEGGPRGGLTMVNERGRELLRTQQGDLIDAIGGETIVPAGQSASMAAAAGGGRGGGMAGPIVVQVMLDKRKIGEAMVDYVRKNVGGKAGGSVSTFFGGKP
ncbi:MAG TPA: phage tail tape measure protein [Propionibacteriaceae bacterium]|nr:phage tail tape measure protein [Propionibacteriaceae bacterium]